MASPPPNVAHDACARALLLCGFSPERAGAIIAHCGPADATGWLDPHARARLARRLVMALPTFDWVPRASISPHDGPTYLKAQQALALSELTRLVAVARRQGMRAPDPRMTAAEAALRSPTDPHTVFTAQKVLRTWPDLPRAHAAAHPIRIAAAMSPADRVVFACCSAFDVPHSILWGAPSETEVPLIRALHAYREYVPGLPEASTHTAFTIMDDVRVRTREVLRMVPMPTDVVGAPPLPDPPTPPSQSALFAVLERLPPACGDVIVPGTDDAAHQARAPRRYPSLEAQLHARRRPHAARATAPL